MYPYLLPLLCLTEHHLNHTELDHTNLEYYTRNLGVAYSRQLLRQGGACIFVHEKLQFSNTDLNKFCKEQDLEVCAVKLQPSTCNICILSTCRAPSGNFIFFLNGLDDILKTLFSNIIQLIICGDINVNYLEGSNRKKQLDSLLSSFNLTSTLHFPTRIQNNSISAIDIIFIDLNKSRNYIISPLINGMSDHDGQIIHINNSNIQIHNSYTQSVRKFSKSSMNKFLTQLSYESWDSIFTDHDVDTIFNAFHNTYLRIFYSKSPKKKKQVEANTKSNPWMTRGIKISCCNKRELYLTLRNSNDPKLKCCYKMCCKILSNVIRAAKKLYYNRLISNSNNKRKTTWNIIKTVTGRKFNNAGIQALNIDGKLMDHRHTITESLNNYFLTIADKINTNNTNLDHSIHDDAYKYPSQAFMTPFPKIKLNYTSTKETENIIKFLT